ncbi:unnamed protein product [Pylaiella littoralis]
MDKQQLQPPRKRSTDTCSVSQDEGDGCVALGYDDDGSSTATAGAIDGSKGTTAAGQLHCCARPLKRGACGSGGDDGGLFCQIEEVGFILYFMGKVSEPGVWKQMGLVENKIHQARRNAVDGDLGGCSHSRGTLGTATVEWAAKVLLRTPFMSYWFKATRMPQNRLIRVYVKFCGALHKAILSWAYNWLRGEGGYFLKGPDGGPKRLPPGMRLAEVPDFSLLLLSRLTELRELPWKYFPELLDFAMQKLDEEEFKHFCKISKKTAAFFGRWSSGGSNGRTGTSTFPSAWRAWGVALFTKESGLGRRRLLSML